MANDSPSEGIDIVPAERRIRVSNIIDDFKIVLTAGTKDGVRMSDRFLIYGIGPDVVDPETGENLGSLELVRGRGKVLHLQERFCTITSSTEKLIPGSTKTIRRQDSGIRTMGQPFRRPIEEVIEGEKTIIIPFEKVEIGDIARKIS
tara:strand:+ start:4439 stop:4879 length:441 start_codon:yes stop_codon:yes gene_type:complete